MILKNNKIIFLSLLFVFIICISTVSAVSDDVNLTTSDNDKIEVLAPQDKGVDNVDKLSVLENEMLSADDDSFRDLNQTINGGGNVIELTHDYNYRYGDLDGVTISKDNIIIDGKGHIIDAKGQSKVFTVTGNNVTLNNIIIVNAFLDKTYTVHNNQVLIVSEGSAISWLGHNGTLSNSKINDNKLNIVLTYSPDYYMGSVSVHFAAGVAWAGENGTIYKTTFNHNNITNNGTTAIAGGLFVSGENCTVINSDFIKNEAYQAPGLALSGSNGTIIGSTFSMNNATREAAMRIIGAYCNVSDCKFINNNATQISAFSCSGLNGLITNCTIINNTATGNNVAYIMNNGTILDCKFINNTGNFYSGITMANANLLNTLFINNTNRNITKADIGVVYTNDNSLVSGCTFINCLRPLNCGGYNIIISNSTFLNCYNPQISSNAWGGGAIYLSTHPATIIGCTFINNTASKGGAIYSNSGKIEVYNSTFINNSAQDHGAMNSYYNSTVSGCIFINNTASTSSSALFSSTGSSVSNCTFISNNGAPAIAAQARNTISDCIFINNKINSTGLAAVYISNRDSSILGCTFINNTHILNNAAGAIRLASAAMNTTIKYNVFINSTSNKDNGILISSTDNLVNCNWFGSNNPTYSKGSVLIASLEKSIDDNYVVGNEWNGIVKVVFHDNVTGEVVTTIKRPIIYNLTNPNIKVRGIYTTESGKVFADNEVKQGFNVSVIVDNQKLGPVEFAGLEPSSSSTFNDLQILINGLFEGETLHLTNSYTYNSLKDGVINITKSIVIAGNVIISGSNQSPIFNITADNVELVNLTLSNGKSTSNGGAIIWNANNGKLTNVKFTNNNAFGFGGAIYATGNNMIIDNSYFNGNIAQDGSALYIIGNNIILSDSVFDNNKATLPAGVEIFIKGNESEISKVTVNNTGNAINVIGANLTFNDITLDNIKGNGIIADGNANIEGVFINNLNGTGITTTNTSNIKNINATGGKGTVIDAKGDNSVITDVVVSEHDGNVVKAEGNNIAVNEIIAINTTGEVVSVKGNKANIKNIDVIGGEGTIAEVIGDNTVIDHISSKNHTGKTVNVVGKGSKISNLPAGDPEKSFIIPTNITSNSPTFGLNDLEIDATGNFEVYVDGKLYNYVPVTKGRAESTITVYNMISGSHNITLTYSGDSTYQKMSQAITITIPESIPVITLTGNNLNVDYTGLATYKVQVLADGKNITDGTNITITFNNVKYTVKTVNGTATLTLNTAIPVGTYTITANYTNKTTTNSVIIKNIINANKLKKLKKSKKVNKVKITLLKVDGKVQVGKTIILKLKNKKVASAKTNKKGVATLKVKKKALKKFKKGKKVVATVIYGADTVTKKIKIA